MPFIDHQLEPFLSLNASKTPAFAHVNAYVVILISYMEVVVMMMIYFCICLKIVKKQCICACKRAQPSGDTQHLLALGPYLGPMNMTRWPLDASRCPKMAQDGPKVTQDGHKMAPRWPQDGPQGGLGGGFRSMTSYKNEHLTTNACQRHADIGFTPL